MAFKLYRHNTPHRMVTANSTRFGEDAEGMALGYDPTCAECDRVGFCTYDQGPCTIAGPDVEPEEHPANETCEFCADPDTIWLHEHDGEPVYSPVYSTTDACPMCGEIHPV